MLELAQRLCLDLPDALACDGKLLPDFLKRRLTPDLMKHLTRSSNELVDGFDHMHGNTNGPRLIGNRARDRLPDPPCGIGGKLVAAAILKFIDGLHQADIAFLYEIEELQ